MRKNLTLRIVVSVIAVLLAAAHVWRPDVKIDSITLSLLVICALPWLQPLVKTVELLGVKLELQELQNKVAEAKGAAESASQKAGLALSASQTTTERAIAVEGDATAAIQSLVDEYEHIRATQRASDARTAAMTNVVSRMIELARRTQGFDVAGHLKSTSRGMRLYAYISLYARPDTKLLAPLVDAVVDLEDTPFGQYWGLQSIGRVMAVTPSVPAEVKRKLELFGMKLPRGTDREYELKKLLHEAN